MIVNRLNQVKHSYPEVSQLSFRLALDGYSIECYKDSISEINKIQKGAGLPTIDINNEPINFNSDSISMGGDPISIYNNPIDLNDPIKPEVDELSIVNKLIKEATDFIIKQENLMG